jgi:iron(III) transport system permease protein
MPDRAGAGAMAVTTGRARPGVRFSEGQIKLAFTLLAAVPLLVFVLFPLWAILQKSFITRSGTWGLDNYVQYFTEPKFITIINNSFAVSISATVVTIVLAYVFAYAMHRSAIPLKKLWMLIAMLPLFAPSLVQALGFQLMLGRNGLVNRTFGTGIDIYGFWGIFLANTLYALPQAILMLSAALVVADARLYESARMLGGSSWRIFWTVTLPATRYGVMSAIFVVFTIVITDFGNAMVIGGDYGVLATEIYNQVSGQANFSLGAVIGMVLLVPAAVAVIIERQVSRRQSAAITEGSVPLTIKPSRRFDMAMLACVVLICMAILLIIGIVIFASFVRLWPYNMTLTFNNYDVDVQGGYGPLWTSIWMSSLTAIIGVVMVVVAAYVIQKLANPFTRFLYFLSILPAAVPGMVLGLGYIFAFNDPANPVYLIYGTILMLAINTVYHYHAQGFLIATTSLKQISSTFDEASAMLGGSFLHTMRKITLPIIWPTLISLGVFFFMRAMVTLAAVIFLVSPGNNLAAVSVLLLDDSGETTQAAAFSTLIMVVVVVVLLVFQGVLRLFRIRNVSLIS